MALPYYTHDSGKPANQTRAIAAEMRDELDRIAQSFNLLPLPASIVAGLQNYGVDTGTANAYSTTLSPLLISYPDGLTIRLKAANANTGPSTINVNGLGIREVVRPDGSSLAANDIYAGQILQLSYNGATSQFQLAITPLAAVYQAQQAASNASASAGSAATSANAASGSASSASTSAGQSAASAGLAMQWAVSMSLVDGTYFGARKYAIDASNSATSAAGSASAAAASATLAAQTFNGTSSSSITVAVGSINFTTQTGKAWVVGQRVSVARAGDPNTVMYGAITSYNSPTGATSVSVDRAAGSGTYSDWSIGLSGANGAPAVLNTVLVGANTTAVAGNYYLFVGAFTINMPTNPATGDMIGFGMSRGVVGGIVNFGSINVKGKAAGSMTMITDTDSAVVQYSGNTTDGWRQV